MKDCVKCLVGIKYDYSCMYVLYDLGFMTMQSLVDVLSHKLSYSRNIVPQSVLFVNKHDLVFQFSDMA